MKHNGIWKIELLGPYGWESMATAFLEDGAYKGGARNHYAVGPYRVSGNKVEFSLKYVTHGEARTIFGKKVKDMDLELAGEVDGDTIVGQARERGGKFPVTFRATRLADLP